MSRVSSREYIMKNLSLVFLLFMLAFPAVNQVTAADIEFGSFEAAESAAQKRAQEYKQKMDEHMKNIQEDWEDQQKDLGSDNSNPDITKITSRSDGQKSSDTDAANSMENAVNSSVNKLKETMVSTAGPNSTGFAGGGAGYQWSVKYVGGKYVLSDSYNEADFNTGKKKDKPAATPKEEPKANQGSDDKKTVVAKAPEKPEPATTPTTSTPADSPDNPAPTQVAKVPGTQTSSTPGKSTSSPAEPGSSSSSSNANPAKEGSSPTCKPGEDCSGTSASPGVDPAPANLPPPAVRLVIQHPTDFSEEVFSSNTDKDDSSSYDLEKFKIPEDTRVKIAVEVSEDVDPEDVTLVIVDEEGERSPVAASKMGNYRHMFRVPSDGNYSANVYVTDKEKPGNPQKKLMQVKIPVTKVDFESRTIDNQRGTKSSDGSSSSSMSSTSSSGSAGNFKHSGQSQSQQVDLSDLYSEPGSESSTTGSENAGSSGASAPGASSSSSGASAAGSSGDSANGSSDYASAQSGNTADGYSSGSTANGSSADGSSSYAGQGTSGQAQDGSNSATGENGVQGDDSNAANTTENAGDTASYNGNSSGSGGSEAGSSDETGNSYGSAGDRNADRTGSESDPRRNAGSDGASDGDSSYTDAGSSDSVYGNGDSANATSEDDRYQDAQYASAQGVSSSSSTKGSGSSSSGAANAQTGDIPEEEAEEDNFIMSVGLRSEAHKIYQSFDFAEDPNQKSTTLPAESEIIFNIVLGKQVDFDSVSIQMADGAEVFGGNLRTMGEAFAYSFKNASPDSYIQISGRAGKVPFTYRLSTPVAKK